nr:hypothetical protein [Tanacetum cinerariifolium]
MASGISSNATTPSFRPSCNNWPSGSEPSPPTDSGDARAPFTSHSGPERLCHRDDRVRHHGFASGRRSRPGRE